MGGKVIGHVLVVNRMTRMSRLDIGTAVVEGFEVQGRKWVE